MSSSQLTMRESLLKILDRARWAPSGDNTQPWRFEIVDDDYIIVHGFDTRDEILYDYEGHASHIAHGALLETIRIAASAEQLSAVWRIETDTGCSTVKYHIRLRKDPDLQPDSRYLHIEARCVQRRPMRLKSLSEAQRLALIAAAGDDYELRLFESFSERKRVAKLLWNSAFIRLTCPEAYPVHSSIIEWGAKFSKDRIPEQAVGVDPMTARLMRWVMHSWSRVDFFNRYLFGTVAPRIQLDYLPAIFCSAHVLIKTRKTLETIEDWVALGGAMQRFWLEASRQGLYLQPEMTPLIFGWYCSSHRQVSSTHKIETCVRKLTQELVKLGDSTSPMTFGFFGRLGVSNAPKSRSLRLDLEDLIYKSRS